MSRDEIQNRQPRYGGYFPGIIELNLCYRFKTFFPGCFPVIQCPGTGSWYGNRIFTYPIFDSSPRKGSIPFAYRLKPYIIRQGIDDIGRFTVPMPAPRSEERR